MSPISSSKNLHHQLLLRDEILAAI